jgi:hypothetical protein
MGRLFLTLLALFVLSVAPAGAGQSADARPDLDSIRSALAGTWQRSDDTKFTREFDPDGQAIDRYEGDGSATTPGTWIVFSGSAAPRSAAGYKMSPNGIYLELDQNGDQLLFALVGLSRSELRIVSLVQGTALTFVRLK